MMTLTRPDSPWLSSRVLLCALFVAILIYISSSHVYSASTPPPVAKPKAVDHTPETPLQVSPAPPPPPEKWTWDPTRDRNNHSLTWEQCSDTFPDLYHEIDRAAAYWRTRTPDGKLSRQHYDLSWSEDGGLMVMIYDQQLYITYSRGLNDFLHWSERHKSTLLNLHRALLASPEPVPNMEFSIKINDRIELNSSFPDVTTWTFSRNISDPVMEQVWLMPDFNFWAYPRVAGSYGSFQRQAMEIDAGDDAGWQAKKDLLVWRGTLVFNSVIRGELLKQTENQPWSDVRIVKEDSDDEDSLRNHISITDHCKYKYTIHTEGWSWSGRLKYLWSCHSVIFIHKLTHYTHLYHLLTPSGPEQNYVAVENDFVDLPGKMDNLLANPAEAKKIADNAAAKFRDRYVTPAAQDCYWRRLMSVWAGMLEQEPGLYEFGTGEFGERVRRRREVLTFEEYMFYTEDFPVQENVTEVKNGF